MNGLVAALERGAVVAIATESFFGFFADATRSDAIDVLLSLKPRGSDKGMPLVLPNRESWHGLVPEVPPAARALADAFWPGALSIALPPRAEVDPRLSLDGTLAVRLPGACPAAELARAFGKPLTATSANLPGEPPATRSEDVLRVFQAAFRDGRLVVEAGESPGGAPSSVVVIEAEGARLLRDGRVPRAELARVLGGVGVRLDESRPRR